MTPQAHLARRRARTPAGKRAVAHILPSGGAPFCRTWQYGRVTALYTCETTNSAAQKLGPGIVARPSNQPCCPVVRQADSTCHGNAETARVPRESRKAGAIFAGGSDQNPASRVSTVTGGGLCLRTPPASLGNSGARMAVCAPLLERINE